MASLHSCPRSCPRGRSNLPHRKPMKVDTVHLFVGWSRIQMVQTIYFYLSQTDTAFHMAMAKSLQWVTLRLYCRQNTFKCNAFYNTIFETFYVWHLGRVKRWSYFENPIPNQCIDSLEDDFRFVCAVCNEYVFTRSYQILKKKITCRKNFEIQLYVALTKYLNKLDFKVQTGVRYK